MSIDLTGIMSNSLSSTLTTGITNVLSNSLNNNLNNNLNNSLSRNETLENQQNSFLQSNLWKSINSGLNVGIKALLPDFVEDVVIGIKEALVNNGLQGGIQKAIETAKEVGGGLATIVFQNATQAYNTLKNGNLIGEVGEAITNSINSATKNKEITSEVSKTLTNGTQTLMNSIEENIKESFSDQLKSLEKLNKYNNNWREAFEKKDFTGMEKEYKKMENLLNKVVPTENTIKQTRIIQNLHNLIKNNNKNFDISEEQIKLAKKLA